MSLRLENIRLRVAPFTIEVDAELNSQIVGIFGPSGAGKTSLLDLMAGLRRAESARIILDGRVLTDTSTGLELPPRRRQIAYVPQDLALFPHLSVKGNLTYARRGRDADAPLFSYEHVTEVLEIQSLADRSVLNLSGGEQRRVSLARALLSAPRLMLLDEPLANLDAKLKARLVPYLQRVRDEFRLPMIYVTHDADEVAALCDEVLILDRGRCVQRGRPDKVFVQQNRCSYIFKDQEDHTAGPGSGVLP